MPKLTKTQRDAAWDLCAKRDGKRCKRCKRKASKDTSVVDHIDNNHNNNPESGKNWQILCGSCNTKKNPRGAGKRGIDVRHKMRSLERERGRARKDEPEDDRTKAESESMKRNIERKPMFLEWLHNMVMEMRQVLLEDIINGGAKVSGLSQQTVRRYIDAETSIAGEFEKVVVNEVLYLKFRDDSANAKLALVVQNWKSE